MIDCCICAFIYGSRNAFSLMMKCSFPSPCRHVRGEGDDMIYWLPLGITTAAWIDFDNDRDWLWKSYMIFQLGFWQQRHVQRSKYLHGSPVQKSQRQTEKQVSTASKEPMQIITSKY